MSSFQMRCALLGMGVVLTASALAAGSAVNQTDAPSGSIELTNLGGDAEVAPPGSVQTDPMVEPAAAPVVNAEQAAAPVAAASKAESADQVAERATKYRDQMLKAKVTPDGKSVNPSLQRRYLMVNKSEYLARQAAGQ